MAEIKKKADFITCCTQIIIYLTTVSIIQLSHSLEFNNNVAVTNKVCTIGLFQLNPVIIYLSSFSLSKGTFCFLNSISRAS